MTVLIVEDDKRVSKEIVDAIMGSKAIPYLLIDVSVVGNAYDAIEYLKQYSPDAIVLDMGIPMRRDSEAKPMAGAEIWRRIRERNKDKTTPIIINTGLEYGEIKHMLDGCTRYSNKNTDTVVRHLAEMM